MRAFMEHGFGKHLWQFDALKPPWDYCVDHFLAKSIGIQTIVLITNDNGDEE